MTRAERYAQIRPLRDDEGLTWREIGERLGIALKFACDVYHDPTGERVAKRRKASILRLQHPCERCGRPTSDARCWDCYTETRRLRLEERLARVAAMYHEGMSTRAIAQALGYGPNSQPPEIIEARRRGLIGYRYKGWEQRVA